MRSPLKICKEIEFFLNFLSPCSRWQCRYRRLLFLPSDFWCAWQTLTFSSFLVSTSRWADVAHVCVCFFTKSTILSTDDSQISPFFPIHYSFLFFSIFDPVTRSSSWSQFERRHSVKKSTLSLPHCHPTFLFALSAELSTNIAFMCDQLTRRVGCEFAYNSSHTFGACSCST